jgi:DNA-binding CsgD family transcriptional regulator
VHSGLLRAWPPWAGSGQCDVDHTPAYLPQEPNRFIGREHELAELQGRLRQARALILCGPGGIGKTRLALRVLAAAADEFPDGTWFVELADLRQPDLVAYEVASAPPSSLTPREHEIAALIATGRSNKAIAAELSISPTTVARHVANILAKLGFRSRTQVAAWMAAWMADRPSQADGPT